MSRILMVASEAEPFVKTGGLADVLGSLPAALVRRGEEVAVVLPRYRVTQLNAASRVWYQMPIQVGPHSFLAAVDLVMHQGVRYYFIHCPVLFDRAGVYNEGGIDYPDNHIRYAALNVAAIFIARNIFRPDVFHGHDWQGGLLPYFLRTRLNNDPTFFGAKSLLTIHNLGYQGNFPGTLLGDLGLDPSDYHGEGLEFYGQVSFLKAGIVWADALSTVSPTYAQEIQTPEFGFGFDGLIRPRAGKLTGILNGADYTEWNPETDPYITARYSATDLSGKWDAKSALLREFSLPNLPERPLFGVVSRFTNQKGFDLIAAAASELVKEDLAFVILGSGEPYYENLFKGLGATYPDKFGVRIGYNNGLAHRIEAGADLFLMPSRYEPCGLSQLYSLRYGTVPVVRATGGLQDTVDAETGFKFNDYSVEALLSSIREALSAWQDQTAWRDRMRRGMARDFSWDFAASQYQDLYGRL